MSIAIETLLKEIKQLEAKRHSINEDFNKQIRELMNTVETLSGKKTWELMAEYKYDDENPNYITGNEDGV